MKVFNVNFKNKNTKEQTTIKVNSNGVEKAKMSATKVFKATNKSANISDYDISVVQILEDYGDI